jgi:hypothetical protein
MFQFSVPLTSKESLWDDEYIPRSNEIVDRKVVAPCFIPLTEDDGWGIPIPIR